MYPYIKDKDTKIIKIIEMSNEYYFELQENDDLKYMQVLEKKLALHIPNLLQRFNNEIAKNEKLREAMNEIINIQPLNELGPMSDRMRTIAKEVLNARKKYK